MTTPTMVISARVSVPVAMVLDNRAHSNGTNRQDVIEAALFAYFTDDELALIANDVIEGAAYRDEIASLRADLRQF